MYLVLILSCFLQQPSALDLNQNWINWDRELVAYSASCNIKWQASGARHDGGTLSTELKKGHRYGVAQYEFIGAGNRPLVPGLPLPGTKMVSVSNSYYAGAILLRKKRARSNQDGSASRQISPAFFPTTYEVWSTGTGKTS